MHAKSKTNPKRSYIQWCWSGLLLLSLLAAIGWWQYQERYKPHRPLDLISKVSGATLNQGTVMVQQWATANGTRVYFSPRVGLPMVDVVLRWEAGSTQEGEHAGLANLTRAVLIDGPSTLTANQLAEKLENLGIDLYSTTTEDYTEISFRTLNDADKIKQAVSILSELMTKPAFREEDLDRNRKNILAVLEYKSHNPPNIAQDAFYKALYGTHPYGREVLGDAEQLQQFTLPHLKEFYAQHFSTKNLSVAVVGQLKSRQVETLVNDLTKNLPTHEKAQPKLIKAEKVAAEQRIAFPSTQTKLILGSVGIAANDPDRYALLVGNQILGGNTMQNRLIKEIRIDRGLAYDPRSSFDLRALSGTFMLSFGTRNEQAKEAEQVARLVLEQFIHEGPTEEELAKIKQTILGKIPLKIASNADVLKLIADLGFHQLALNDIDQLQEAVTRMTTKDIREAFQRHIDPKNLVLVTVGASA